MNSKRWSTIKKQPTAAEKRAIEREKAFAQCQQYHSYTPTFRPGESVCLTCGFVKFCPVCLQENNLPEPNNEHAFSVLCATHTKAEVQA